MEDWGVFFIYNLQCKNYSEHTICISQILQKKWEYNEAVHQPFIDFKKSYNSIRRDVLYNIFIEFGSPTKLVRLIKMCLNETYSRVRVGKHLSHMFPIRNDLKRAKVLSPLLFHFDLQCSNGAKAMTGILAGAETWNKCSIQLHRQPCIRNSENFSKLRSVNYVWTRALQSVLLKLCVWNHWQSAHSTASMYKRQNNWICHWLNTPGHTVLGSTQFLTEKSTTGKGRRCVGLKTLPHLRSECLEIMGPSNSWRPNGFSGPV